jgi:hypothetical protein
MYLLMFLRHELLIANRAKKGTFTTLYDDIVIAYMNSHMDLDVAYLLKGLITVDIRTKHILFA